LVAKYQQPDPRKSLESHPLFQRVVQLTVTSSLQTAWLALRDEERRRLVTFKKGAMWS